MMIFDRKIKNFLQKKMYFHKDVNSKNKFGKKVIYKLFTEIKKNPEKYINVK